MEVETGARVVRCGNGMGKVRCGEVRRGVVEGTEEGYPVCTVGGEEWKKVCL